MYVFIFIDYFMTAFMTSYWSARYQLFTVFCWLMQQVIQSECVGRSLADVDNNGSLSVDEFCVAMHLVEMTKLGQTLPVVLPLDLVPPAYRTSISRSPLLTATKLNTSGTLTTHVNLPGFSIFNVISTLILFCLKTWWITFSKTI